MSVSEAPSTGIYASNHAPSSAAAGQELRWERFIVLASAAAIVIYLLLRFGFSFTSLFVNLPLYLALLLGGIPLVFLLAKKLLAGEFGSDFLAGVSIVTAVLLQEYLVATIVVLMLSGGAALESYATRRASRVLEALAKRMPTIAHRKSEGGIAEIAVSDIFVGDTLLVHPHEICPVDGIVLEGHGSMNEAYLTGEPFEVEKAPGA